MFTRKGKKNVGVKATVFKERPTNSNKSHEWKKEKGSTHTGKKDTFTLRYNYSESGNALLKYLFCIWGIVHQTKTCSIGHISSLQEIIYSPFACQSCYCCFRDNNIKNKIKSRAMKGNFM